MANLNRKHSVEQLPLPLSWWQERPKRGKARLQWLLSTWSWMARGLRLSGATAMAEERALPYLLDSVRALIVRFVRLPGEEYADAIALWVLHAHAIAAATTSPRLVFKSPEKSSGKTTALDVLETLVPAPLNTVNASVAAVFRLLKDEQATLLFDEVDSIFNVRAANQHEELRALLNAGHRRGATVARVVGEGKKMRVERFPVFAATVLATIGDLPETIESRAIIVPMRRRAPDEVLDQFRQRKVIAVAGPLRECLALWAERYHDELKEREPRMPVGITDRLADSWEPLIAIADLAGEPWASRARAAAIRIAGGHVIDEASTGVQLLGDIRGCLGTEDRISSVNLLAKLNAMDEAQWGGWHGGGGLTARDLARRLKPYGIGSRTYRPIGSIKTVKGYLREDFADAWRRYAPALITGETAVTEKQKPSSELDHRYRVTADTDFTGGEAGANREAPAATDGGEGLLLDEAYFESLAGVLPLDEDEE